MLSQYLIVVEEMFLGCAGFTISLPTFLLDATMAVCACLILIDLTVLHPSLFLPPLLYPSNHEWECVASLTLLAEEGVDVVVEYKSFPKLTSVNVNSDDQYFLASTLPA